LWTLEEAVFGGWGLNYQFYDKALLHGGEVGGLQETHHSFIAAMYSIDLAEALRDLVPLRIDIRGHRLVSLLASCCWRTTSKDLDQVTCLASILNLDVGRILSIQNEDSTKTLDEQTTITLHERMRMFYELFGDPSRTDIDDTEGIPIHMLFMDGAPSHIPWLLVGTCIFSSAVSRLIYYLIMLTWSPVS
jgi:hypothetical protein